ncbi:MAG: putative Ig domain-containing protein [Chthoniobacterales bacterium]
MLDFSPDDRVAYQYGSSQGIIYLFSTRRFVPLAMLHEPNSLVNDLRTDRSGRYLFAATDDFFEPSKRVIQVYDVSTKLAPPATAHVGVSFSYQVAFDFAVTSFSASDLPAGLAIDSETGLISGTPTARGSYSVLVTGSDGVITESKEVSLSIFPDSRALNISTRLKVGSGDNVLIAGFIIQGETDKNVVLRALGPSLTSDGQPVAGSLANPILELHDATGATIASNDDWVNDAQADQLKALQIAPTEPKEAALYRTLAPGSYTAIVRGVSGGTGIGLVELYDVEGGQLTRLSNISTRGEVGSADNVMIGGVIVGGPDDAEMIVRAIGPSLLPAGVSGVLSDPQLDLYNGEGTKIASNNDWRETQEAAILATGIAPFNDREAAILRLLSPGAYTAIVSGVDGTTGVALVEAYNLP